MLFFLYAYFVTPSEIVEIDKNIKMKSDAIMEIENLLKKPINFGFFLVLKNYFFYLKF
jgi:hypothetical protein